MTVVSENNKRIAKNTIVLYIRMLLVMGVSLYTSRVVLNVLGVEDYGIYNVVGGVASSFLFFSSSLSNATQRYLNFELGKNSIIGANHIFNLSLAIYLCILILVLVLGEVFGLLFIKYKLVIPPERLNAALLVFHTTLLSLAVILISSVFDSVLIARENMTLYAYLSIFEVVAKLLVVFFLSYSSYDKLALYALLMLSITLINKLILVKYCFSKYPECKIKYYWNLQTFKNVFGFVGWNGIGTAVWMINEQGVNILLNIFFGPIVNAARAIAAQVNATINNFSINFFTAVRPQIIKSYAGHDLSYFNKLIFNSSRYSFYLMWVLCTPFILKSEYILNLWLVKVPNLTSDFVIWVLIYSCVNVLSNPIWCAIQAVGKLKRYILVGSFIYLMAFPINYILFKLDFSPVVAFQVLAVIRLIYLFVVVRILNMYTPFNFYEYLNRVFQPIIIVVILTFIINSRINILLPDSFFNFCIISIITLIINICCTNFRLSRKS